MTDAGLLLLIWENRASWSIKTRQTRLHERRANYYTRDRIVQIPSLVSCILSVTILILLSLIEPKEWLRGYLYNGGKEIIARLFAKWREIQRRGYVFAQFHKFYSHTSVHKCRRYSIPLTLMKRVYNKKIAKRDTKSLSFYISIIIIHSVSKVRCSHASM